MRIDGSSTVTGLMWVQFACSPQVFAPFACGFETGSNDFMRAEWGQLADEGVSGLGDVPGLRCAGLIVSLRVLVHGRIP